MQTWQTFLALLHIWQACVFLYRAMPPGRHLKTVKGRSQILHAWPNFCLHIRKVNYERGKNKISKNRSKSKTYWGKSMVLKTCNQPLHANKQS